MKQLGKPNIFYEGTLCFECNREEFRLSEAAKLFEIDNLTYPEFFTITFRVTGFFTENIQLGKLFHPIQAKGILNKKNFIGPI